MEPDTIAVAIRKARLYAGLTQKQVAEALEKSQTTVAAWESGRSQPDAKTLVQLSALFQVSSDFLLGISNFHNKSSEVFLSALLGEESCLLPQHVRDPLSQFTTDLIGLCDLVKEADIELLPHAIKSLAGVMHILEDLITTYAKYVHMVSVNCTAANLLEEYSSLSDAEKKQALESHELLGELLEQCAKLNETMKMLTSKEFAGEALRKIENARDSVAVFALHLSAKLDLGEDDPSGYKQDHTK